MPCRPVLLLLAVLPRPPARRVSAVAAALVEISWGLVVLAWVAWGAMALQHPLYTLPVLRILGWSVWLAGILWLYNLTPAALALVG